MKHQPFPHRRSPAAGLGSLLRFLREAEGVAAIEFAVIVPVLIVLMVCTVEFGLAFHHRMQVHNAAQAGAQYAMVRGFNASAITSAVLNATSYAEISATPAPTQFCGCATEAGVTETACGTPCPGGTTPGSYVRVSAHAVHRTLVPYPLVPETFTFSSQSTVRIQ